MVPLLLVVFKVEQSMACLFCWSFREYNQLLIWIFLIVVLLDAAGLLLRIYIDFIIGTQALAVLLLGLYAHFDPSFSRQLAREELNPRGGTFFHTSSCFYNAG